MEQDKKFKQLSDRIRKVANRIIRMSKGISNDIDGKKIPIVKKIEDSYRDFVEMHQELEEDIASLESKKAGISLQDQKDMVGRVLKETAGVYSQADTLHYLGGEVVKLNKSNLKIKDIYIKIRNYVIKEMSNLHRIDVYTHTPTERNDVRTQHNNFGAIKRKYGILIGKM